MHFTPAGSSWMNLVERFFADLTGDCIREGSFRSVRELIEAFEKYLADRNANPKRYVWRAKGEEILRKIERAKEALAGRLEPDNSKYMTLEACPRSHSREDLLCSPVEVDIGGAVLFHRFSNVFVDPVWPPATLRVNVQKTITPQIAAKIPVK